jgi:hypothetical protein
LIDVIVDDEKRRSGECVATASRERGRVRSVFCVLASRPLISVSLSRQEFSSVHSILKTSPSKKQRPAHLIKQDKQPPTTVIRHIHYPCPESEDVAASMQARAKAIDGAAFAFASPGSSSASMGIPEFVHSTSFFHKFVHYSIHLQSVCETAPACNIKATVMAGFRFHS